MERLDKLLAGTGKWSRREVKALVRQGLVRVDGRLAASAEDKLDPAAAIITVAGETISLCRFTYVMLHKPAGVLTATEDRKQPTVLDLLPPELRRIGLAPVGRLDKDSEGLLLMTSDGEIINRILRAAGGHEKEYEVEIDRPVTKEFVEKMSAGVPILDTVTLPCRVRRTGEKSFNIILVQGLNRQIRRMCEAAGLRVLRLRRTQEGTLRLGMLPSGKWRELTKEEIESLNGE